MSHDEEHEPNAAKKVVGKVEAALGWATADRKVEAHGKLVQLEDEPADATESDESAKSAKSDQADEEALLDQAETHVRADHGDLAPEAEPSRDEQPVKANPIEGG